MSLWQKIVAWSNTFAPKKKTKTPPVIVNQSIGKGLRNFPIKAALVILLLIAVSIGITLAGKVGFGLLGSLLELLLSLPWMYIAGLALLIVIGRMLWKAKPWQSDVKVPWKKTSGILLRLAAIGLVIFIGYQLYQVHLRDEAARERMIAKQVEADSTLSHESIEAIVLPAPDSGKATIDTVVYVGTTTSPLYIKPPNCKIRLDKRDSRTWLMVETQAGTYEDRPGAGIQMASRPIERFRLRAVNAPGEVKITIRRTNAECQNPDRS